MIIQAIDADITCPDPDYEGFSEGLASVLHTLRRGSAHTRVFVTTDDVRVAMIKAAQEVYDQR